MNKEKLKLSLIGVSTLIITILKNIACINKYYTYFLIPIILFLIISIYFINKSNYETNKSAYKYLLPIILIIIGTIFIKIDDTNMVLNIFILPLLLTIFFLKLINNKYKLDRFIIKWTLNIFKKDFFTNLKELKLPSSLAKGKKKKILNILLGLTIGIILATILLSLLISADAYFEKFIGSTLKYLTNLFNIKYIFTNIITLTIFFIIFFTVLQNILKNKNTPNYEVSIKNIDNYLANTILIIVNFVFLLFLVSNISKITTNFLNIPIEYTYAKYAREGFFQLLIVTSINAFIILFFLYYTNIINKSKSVKNLILILISFSIILIFNSYYRLFLYINEYGFTTLRLQVILFLLMELILFLVITKKIIKELKYKDAYIFLSITITTYIINLYTCNEPIINFINKLLHVNLNK